MCLNLLKVWSVPIFSFVCAVWRGLWSVVGDWEAISGYLQTEWRPSVQFMLRNPFWLSAKCLPLNGRAQGGRKILPGVTPHIPGNGLKPESRCDPKAASWITRRKITVFHSFVLTLASFSDISYIKASSNRFRGYTRARDNPKRRDPKSS